MKTDFYSAMISTAVKRGEAVQFNVPVEGTQYKLLAYFPERNMAFADATYNPTLYTKDEMNEKMSIIKEVSGVETLFFWQQEV